MVYCSGCLMTCSRPNCALIGNLYGRMLSFDIWRIDFDCRACPCLLRVRGCIHGPFFTIEIKFKRGFWTQWNKTTSCTTTKLILSIPLRVLYTAGINFYISLYLPLSWKTARRVVPSTCVAKINRSLGVDVNFLIKTGLISCDLLNNMHMCKLPLRLFSVFWFLQHPVFVAQYVGEQQFKTWSLKFRTHSQLQSKNNALKKVLTIKLRVLSWQTGTSGSHFIWVTCS